MSLGEEQGEQTATVSAPLPADPDKASQVGISGLPFAGQANFEMSVGAVTFSSVQSDWHVGVDGARDRTHKWIAATVGKGYGLLGVAYCFGYLPQRQFDLAHVTDALGRVPPIFLSDCHLHSRLHRFEGLGQPA